MGGGQSQERVVGVEEKYGDGEPQIIVRFSVLLSINLCGAQQLDPMCWGYTYTMYAITAACSQW